MGKRAKWGGGVRQRQEASRGERAEPAPDISHSRLARLLLAKFFWAQISMSLVTEIALAAFEDGLVHEDIKQLKGLGSDGIWKANITRDFYSRFVIAPLEKAISRIVVPWRLPASATMFTDVNLLLPHRVFSVLYHCYPAEFARRMYSGSKEKIAAFWEGQSDHPAMDGHPMLTHVSNYREYCLPLFLHGDDVAVVGCGKIWSQGVDVISFGSLLGGSGHAALMHFLISLIWIPLMAETATRHTIDEVWKQITWSLKWLGLGRHPDVDADGNPIVGGFFTPLSQLAGGFFAHVWSIRTDLDWARGRLGMLGTCKNCAGNTTTKKWTDSRKGPLSSWFSSIYTNAMYAAAFPNRHRLFKEVPGLGITHYIADILHSKWLGADQYFLGSAIALLTHHWMEDTPAVNLVRVWGDVRDEYGRQNVPHKNRYSKIRISQYFAQSLKLPKLKGTGVQCQGLTKVFAKVFEKHMDGDDPVHVLVLQGLKLQRRIDRLFLRNYRSYRMPAADSLEVIAASYELCRVVSDLIKHFHPLDIPLFNFTIKLHNSVHIALTSAYTNPCHGDCNSGENFQKTMKAIVKSCTHGCKPPVATANATVKFVKALDMELGKAGKWWK